MKKFFLALLLAASAACMAAQVAFADDSGFIAGGGSAGSGSGVGRDDIATSETASGVGRDDVLAFGSDMKDSVDIPWMFGVLVALGIVLACFRLISECINAGRWFR